ncbi:hypothetical protein ACVV2G_22010 [Streptomyces ziwulingensis]
MLLQLPQGRGDTDLALGELAHQRLDPDRRPGGQRLDVDRRPDRRQGQRGMLEEAVADHGEVVVVGVVVVLDTTG